MSARQTLVTDIEAVDKEALFDAACKYQKELLAHDKQHVLECIDKYLTIRSVHDTRNWPVDQEQLVIDLAHSSLLHRLLEGKPPFEFAPPRSFSCPWYELLENNQASCDVYVLKEQTGANINQCRWDIYETVSETEHIVTFDNNYAARLMLERPDQGYSQWTLYLLPPDLCNLG